MTSLLNAGADCGLPGAKLSVGSPMSGFTQAHYIVGLSNDDESHATNSSLCALRRGTNRQTPRTDITVAALTWGSDGVRNGKLTGRGYLFTRGVFGVTCRNSFDQSSHLRDTRRR